MPTEAQIEAAARVLCTSRGVDPDDVFSGGEVPRWRDFSFGARAALTAAEEVRGKVSEPWGWACWFNEAKNPDIMVNYSDDNRREAARRIEHENWRVVPLYEALARRGAGQVELDEAEIRADERERCAKISETWKERLIVGELLDRAVARLADDIRAAAPNPEEDHA